MHMERYNPARIKEIQKIIYKIFALLFSLFYICYISIMDKLTGLGKILRSRHQQTVYMPHSLLLQTGILELNKRQRVQDSGNRQGIIRHFIDTERLLLSPMCQSAASNSYTG